MSVSVDLQAGYAKSININGQSNTQLVRENQCFTVVVSSATIRSKCTGYVCPALKNCFHSGVPLEC